ncbi:mitochondrial inner membrane protease subunit 2 [Nomia melanderi]|uniref:mitochondrial inner membrane protease subunit 2 n=1 Tax=Nomia melanderi TaxID=2448451 RepID=UPI001303FD68|nr:mitochondrial inner membrane protease subunit 2 [Nomia melanderi]XP_031847196.1 mitochondrial inner membrane protease subunit 2 [Nomia melanderi]
MVNREVTGTYKVRHLVRGILCGIPIAVTILDRIGYIAKVDGISMQPTLNPDTWIHDYVFLNHWALQSEGIQRGEVVALISPKRPNETLIKRVVGLPGDIICSRGSYGQILKVPEGHCWVEGDHTGCSLDSTTFGPVSLGLITAKATCIVWPPKRWQFLNRTTLNHKFQLYLARD